MPLEAAPPPAPTDVKLLLRMLHRGDGEEVREAMKEIVSRREEMTPHLLALLERASANLEHPEIDYIGAVLGMYLFAEFRETRAFDPILRLLEEGDEQLEYIFGDSITENIPAILVSVAEDLAPVVRLARNEARQPYARAAAVMALRVAVATGRMPREEVIRIYGEILRSELNRGLEADEDVCVTLAYDGSDLAARELEPELLQLLELGIVDDSLLDEEDIADSMACTPEEALATLRRDRHNALISDAVEACSWWQLFHEKSDFDPGDDDWLDDFDEPVQTVRYTSPKPGRNAPCPCGSGRKYKNCCGR